MKQREILYILVFFLYPLQLFGDDVHSISGFFIGSEGLNLPNYMERIAVNDVTIFYHDSRKNSIAPCPKWLNTSIGQKHWEDIRVISQHNRQTMNTALESAIQQFNLTALVYKRQREQNPVLIAITAAFYRKTCIDRLKLFLEHAPGVTIKKAPEVRLFQRRRAGSTLVTCHVTGFFPRSVQVKWIGEDLPPADNEINDVLSNGDGTYQTRRSVIIPKENLGDHHYSCVVQHSSLKENITVTWGEAEKHSRSHLWIKLTCFMALGLVILCFIKSYCKEEIQPDYP
ncbi:T-cell surface glycoprotein CD1b4-like isoform X2 [Silurus meridionalis]|uniref:T-cell surface glycoprotein CD1b4-like isoform X2 n=1 Tax=Silurus meridionalis TaxID=175797 RepID=UPI001EECC5EE|nr:T-cell surface glycoprotein CD1b4-like isoform X2 [Silurus meridionalis]